MAWNTTWTDSNLDTLLSIVEINRFVDAINERSAIIAGTTLPAWVAGDSLQDHDKIAAMQSAAIGLCGLPHATFWVPPGPFSGVAWAFGGTYATRPWDWVDAAYVRAHALGGNADYTRKYPREFANGASTTYADGAAFANGHVARREDNDLVYTRTAGAWVLSPGAFPDVLTAYGVCQAGDYLGPWLFNETRDVVNLFSGVDATTQWTSDVGDEKSAPLLSTFATMAAARSDAVSRFAATGNSGTNLFTPQAIAETDQDGSLQYKARLYTVRGYQTISLLTGSPYGGAAYELWIATQKQGTSNGTYDDNGTGYLENAWALADSTTLGAAPLTYKAYAGTGTVPGFTGTPTYPSPVETFNGWITAAKAGIFRPAFVYHA